MRSILETNQNGITFLQLEQVNGRKIYKCLCVCGNTFYMWPPSYYNGRIKSCGCKRVHVDKEDTRLYSIWLNIKTRCYNKNAPAYISYGAKGVIMEEGWKENFELFRDWARTQGYSNNLSIDRIDVYGNYSPSNCRWATPLDQANNKRKTEYIEEGGQKYSVANWCRKHGINYKTFRAYYYTHNNNLNDVIAHYVQLEPFLQELKGGA